MPTESNETTTPETTTEAPADAGAMTEAEMIAAATAGLPTEDAPPAADAPPTEAAPEAAPDKLQLAAETIRKAKKHAKKQRELETALQKERDRSAAFARQVEEANTARARDLEEKELWKKDPLAAIKRANISARDLAKQAIEEGTPEAQMAALRAQFEADREKDRQEMRAELERKLSERDQASQNARAEAAFFGLIKPDTHPRLSSLERDDVVALSRNVFMRATKQGYTPSDLEVLNHVESLLSAPQNGQAGISTPKTNPAGITAGKTVGKPSPTSRTVTADLAGRRYSVPSNVDDMDLNDQKIALAKMLDEFQRES